MCCHVTHITGGLGRRDLRSNKSKNCVRTIVRSKAQLEKYLLTSFTCMCTSYLSIFIVTIPVHKTHTPTTAIYSLADFQTLVIWTSRDLDPPRFWLTEIRTHRTRQHRDHWYCEVHSENAATTAYYALDLPWLYFHDYLNVLVKSNFMNTSKYQSHIMVIYDCCICTGSLYYWFALHMAFILIHDCHFIAIW